MSFQLHLEDKEVITRSISVIPTLLSAHMSEDTAALLTGESGPFSRFKRENKTTMALSS